jgi:hypothetical protein
MILLIAQRSVKKRSGQYREIAVLSLPNDFAAPVI